MAGRIVDGIIMNSLQSCRHAYLWTARSRPFSLLVQAAVGHCRFTLERWELASSDRFSSFRPDFHSLFSIEEPTSALGQPAPSAHRSNESAPPCIAAAPNPFSRGSDAPFADLCALFHIRKNGGALALTRAPSALYSSLEHGGRQRS